MFSQYDTECDEDTRSEIHATLLIIVRLSAFVQPVHWLQMARSIVVGGILPVPLGIALPITYTHLHMYMFVRDSNIMCTV